MKVKYQMALFIIIALLVINSSLATSYSLWIINKTQSGTNIVASGCFEVTYNDLENDISTSINLNNTYPISDTNGVKLKPYKVRIKNNCTIAANYKLIISELNGNTLDKNNIKYYLTNNKGANFGPSNFSDLTSYTIDNAIKSDIETDKNVQIKNSYILATGVLNPSDEEITYEFRMWVKEEAIDVMEKEFNALVSFEAYATETQSS